MYFVCLPALYLWSSTKNVHKMEHEDPLRIKGVIQTHYKPHRNRYRCLIHHKLLPLIFFVLFIY